MSDRDDKKYPRVRIEAGPGFADFKLFLDGKEIGPCVESAEYHIAVGDYPTVTLRLAGAALIGEGRLRLTLGQLRALAEAEGYVLMPAEGTPCPPS